jgi:hypothetical protein
LLPPRNAAWNRRVESAKAHEQMVVSQAQEMEKSHAEFVKLLDRQKFAKAKEISELETENEYPFFQRSFHLFPSFNPFILQPPHHPPMSAPSCPFFFYCTRGLLVDV